MSTEVVIKSYQPSQQLVALEAQCKSVAGIDMGIARIFVRATKVAAIKTVMAQPEMMAVIKTLAGNPAGFFMGKDEKPTETELASVVTEALSRGARMDGGEFTVMKGRAFLNKGYYQRQLDELGHDGSFTQECNYRMMWWDRRESEVVQTGATAKVVIEITYKLVDKRTGQELEPKVELFACWLRTFSSDTPDKWVGQAERRAFQKLLRKLTNVDFGEDEDETPPLALTQQAGPQLGPPQVGVARLGKPAPQAEPTKAPSVEDMASAFSRAQGVAESTTGPARREAEVAAAPVVPPAATTPALAKATAAPPAAKGKDAYDRFVKSWNLVKSTHGLPVCKSVLSNAGYANATASKLDDEILNALADQLLGIAAAPPEVDTVTDTPPAAAPAAPPEVDTVTDTPPAAAPAAPPAAPKPGAFI